MSKLPTVFAVVWIALLAGSIYETGSAFGEASPTAAAYAAELRDATRDLLRAVEILQEDIVDEFSGTTERTLYQQADALLEQVTKLEAGLKSGTDRMALCELLYEIDRKRAPLEKAIRNLGATKRPLQRGVERISACADDVSYVLEAGNTSEVRKHVLERQVNSLARAARSLSKTAQVALGITPGSAELQADLKKLAQACDHLATTCAEAKDSAVVKQECAQVNLAWSRVVQSLRSLPARENAYLIRGAARVDTTYDRVFRMLGMTGDRPKLVIGS